MSKHDWYRKSTWDASDRADFFAHLKRARGSSNKAQYLRIQALCLIKSGDGGMLLEALELLDLMLREYPAWHELAPGYLAKAECLDKLGRTSEAIEMYRNSLRAQRDHPGIITNAALDFGLFAVQHELVELYDEVLSGIIEFPPALALPQQGYWYYAIKALIANHRQESTQACEYARQALEARDRQDSGLSYHPRVGLVRNPVLDIDKRLAIICGN